MSTPPRRRRPDSRNPKREAGGWLPTIAMGLGVIVAGLALGALVAVFMQRSNAKPTPVAAVTPTRAPASVPPVAIATIEPPRTPRPSPSPSATPQPAATDEMTVAPSERPSPARPKVSPSPAVRHPVATAVLPATAAPAHVAVVTAAPRATATETAMQTAASATPAAANVAPPTTEPAATPAVSSAYDEHASAVVRRYVDALIRGDQKSAYTALGGGGNLSELNFLDANARIVSLKVTRIDAANASVGCEISSAKGRFYATYHVTAATSGPYISEHDYIKV